jgi:hypothetical protein
VPKNDFFIDYLKKEINYKNQSFLMLFCGSPGKGKSYAGLSVASKVYPDFIPRKHLVFKPRDIILNVRNATKGQVFIFDEAGVGIPSRQWNSIQNKLFGLFLQVHRYKNVGIIFTTPDISYIDVQARKLFNFIVEMQYVNYEENYSIGKIYQIQHNSINNKTYRKFLRYTDKNGKLRVVSHFKFSCPPEHVCKDYEDYHKEHKDKLIDTLLEGKQSEKKEKKEKVHKCSFVYMKTTNSYKCRTCGKTTTENPFC